MFKGSEGLSESSILHHPGHLARSVRSDRWDFPFGDVGRYGPSKKRKRGSFPVDVPNLIRKSIVTAMRIAFFPKEMKDGKNCSFYLGIDRQDTPLETESSYQRL